MKYQHQRVTLSASTRNWVRGIWWPSPHQFWNTLQYTIRTAWGSAGDHELWVAKRSSKLVLTSTSQTQKLGIKSAYTDLIQTLYKLYTNLIWGALQKKPCISCNFFQKLLQVVKVILGSYRPQNLQVYIHSFPTKKIWGDSDIGALWTSSVKLGISISPL